MTPLEFRLLNEFQRGFPLVAQPYAVLAAALGTDEAAVIEAFGRLRDCGALSRIGAVFRPGALAASTLAAMEVPAERLEAVAAVVSSFPEVNHNYEREHRLNLWFVAAAADAAALDATLARITRLTGIAVLKLPLVEEYHIDLGFPLAGAPAPRTPRVRRGRQVVLGEAHRKLVAALEDGLALEPRPYAALGARGGMGEQAVIDRLAHWQAEGLIRRFGVVVRHHELGWRANAMAVWDVPDGRVRRFGRMLAAAEGVTLAYRRARARPAWPYNLFCMIHGTERGAVAARIAALNRALGLDAFPHAVLFSRTRFKQTGPRFSSVPEAIHG
ncbi:MAG TPA: Lrp/AsnC family transcriptional regulator [Burkholderiales bacterium]|nr:Lrp/AsnC family transcriptional regulator [Burkholderiales bacterium]